MEMNEYELILFRDFNGGTETITGNEMSCPAGTELRAMIWMAARIFNMENLPFDILQEDPYLKLKFVQARAELHIKPLKKSSGM